MLRVGLMVAYLADLMVEMLADYWVVVMEVMLVVKLAIE